MAEGGEETISELKGKGFYIQDGKFIPPLLAGDIVFDGYEIDSNDGINRGYLVTSDNKQIWRYNGGFYESDGEDVIKTITQLIVGERCKSHWKNEVIDWVKDNGALRIDREIFNSDTHLVNTKNGIYNIRTKEFEEHDPSHYFISQIPVKYDPDAKINHIEQFFQDVLYPEDIPVLQELTGYLFYRAYPFQKAFMFDGDGSNGKSTLINLLITLVGQDNISNVSLQDLIYKRFARSQLYNKMANFYSDLSDNAVKDTGVFKMLTGGDMIFADQKFKEPFSFHNYAKLVFSCNKLPMSRDDTDAYFRRWILISFPNKFEGKDCDPNIIKKLTVEPELSGLFNWALEGLQRLLKNGGFSHSKSTDVIRDEYERKSSPILAFVKDCLEQKPNSKETKEAVYNCYKEYCSKEKLPIKANNSFARELKQHVINLEDEQRGNGKRGWMGIKIKGEQQS